MSQTTNLIRNVARTATSRVACPAATEASSAQQLRSVKPFEEIPTPSGFPLLGNLPSLMIKENRRDPVKFHNKIREKHGDIYRFKLPGPGNDIIFINKTDDLKTLLDNDGALPIIPMFDVMSSIRMGPLAAKYKSPGLMTNGETWGHFRRSVQQELMRPKSAIYYIDQLEEVLDTFMEDLEKHMSPDRIASNLNQSLKKFAFESIAITFLGSKTGTFEGDPRAEHLMSQVDQILLWLFPVLFLPERLTKITGIYRAMVKSKEGAFDICNKMVQEAIVRMEKDDTLKDTVLGKLIARNGRDSTIPVVMSTDALIAGMDTTGVTGISLIYHLASNPEKQEKLYQEICQVIGPQGNLSEDGLAKMRYLKACQIESQRLLPVTQAIMRLTQKDMVLDGYHVPANTRVIKVNPVSARDPVNFVQPNDFIPERWVRGTPEHMDKNVQGSDLNFANLPFGHGKRACIGQRFAKLELHLLAAKVVQRYHLESVGEPFTLDYSGTLGVPASENKIRFTPRH